MPVVDPLIGRTLANYRIERLLGRGGMASVYYGIDIQLQRPAAIKVIDERHSGETSFSARFVREARAMAAWRHPNIPQIYQAGVENGVYFYAMEYIHGMDLEELLRQAVRKGELLSFEDVLRYGKAIADALDYAHLKGAIHRDVKPSNVLIAEDGRIMLSDFGLVLQVDKGTQGEVFGSPFYIAPEQARSSAGAVPQSDLYSLGVILYEMVVGRLPFEDQSSASLALKHISLEPPAPTHLNPDLSPEVEAVLLKALRKNPLERYSTSKDLMLALEEGIGGQIFGTRILHSVEPVPDTLPFLPRTAEDHPQAARFEPETSFGPSLGAEPTSPSLAAHELGAKIPSLDRQTYLSRFPKKYILAVVIAASVLTILCVILLGTLWLLDGLKRPSGIAVQASATLSGAQSKFTPTAAPGKTNTPIIVTPSSTPNVHEIRISLSLQEADSFLFVNQGTTGIPLAQLQLKSKKGELNGKDWEIDVLQPGQCVTVLKQQGHPSPPTGTQCQLVGKVLTRSAKDKFWDETVDVYFQKVLVASCGLNISPCEFKFNNPPP